VLRVFSPFKAEPDGHHDSRNTRIAAAVVITTSFQRPAGVGVKGLRRFTSTRHRPCSAAG
jgi:hypothetical protein